MEKKRQTYAQGRRDGQTAILRRIQRSTRERIIAKGAFENLQINGRMFTGCGELIFYESGHDANTFSDRPFTMPGLRGWRFQLRPKKRTDGDDEFIYNIWGSAVEIVIEPDRPSHYIGKAWLTSGSRVLKFEGFGALERITPDTGKGGI